MVAGDVAGGNRDAGAAPSTYVSGERVFGPPVGTFDVDWVAREVERSTPASFAQAHRAVVAAWSKARADGVLDGPVLSAAAGAAGAPPDVAEAIASYVVAYCHAYDVDPAAR